jgi:hypothetical protein
MSLNFLKKITIVFITSLLIFPLLNSYAGEDSETKMHNALAKGYLAASKNDKPSAIDWFKKAGEFARKARSWQGCIDSAYGLLALEQNKEKVVYLFDQALAFAKRNKDWRGCVATGYGYSSLSIILNKKKDAAQAFKQAAIFSKKDGDWRGLLESGKGFFALGETSQAIDYYNAAFKIAKELESAEGLNKLADSYRKSASLQNAKECMRLAESLTPPPPGWEPAGETVAGPPKISPEIQRASRESADKEIAEKTKWLIEQKKAEVKRKERAKVYINYYYPYVNYTYWQRSYGPWTVNWALYRLRNYRFRNGIWYRVYY